MTFACPELAVPASADARHWIAAAMGILDDERRRAAETPMLTLRCDELPGITVLLKDETCHASGSLKHRLAHALFAHAICNGDIGPGTTIVEASSGSTAISEAWFAKRLGLPFVAVVPASTASAKVAAIRWAGGEVVKAEPGEDICQLARTLAISQGGHFMDQFTRAAEVVDWRGSNNIAESLVRQCDAETGTAPAWIVVGAGTGGTSATIGRYLRYRPGLADTRLCVVDPEHSAFFQAYATGDRAAAGRPSPVVEGIGRPRMEPSFVPRIVDQMLSIPDVASVAGTLWLYERLGRRFGPSTGTNIIGTLLLGSLMASQGQSGTIVTLACDGGDRYGETIYDSAWLKAQGLDIASWQPLIEKVRTFLP